MPCDDPGSVIVLDFPYPNHLPRVDYVDPVEVLVFSKSVWAENDVLFIESDVPKGPLR